MTSRSILDFECDSSIKLENLKNVYVIGLRDADQEIQNQAPQDPNTLDLVLIGEDDEKEYLLSYVTCWSDDVADVDGLNHKLKEIITEYNNLVEELKSKIYDLESDLNDCELSLAEKEKQVNDLEKNVLESRHTDEEKEQFEEKDNSFAVVNSVSINELYTQLKKPSKTFKF